MNFCKKNILPPRNNKQDNTNNHHHFSKQNGDITISIAHSFKKLLNNLYYLLYTKSETMWLLNRNQLHKGKYMTDMILVYCETALGEFTLSNHLINFINIEEPSFEWDKERSEAESNDSVVRKIDDVNQQDHTITTKNFGSWTSRSKCICKLVLCASWCCVCIEKLKGDQCYNEKTMKVKAHRMSSQENCFLKINLPNMWTNLITLHGSLCKKMLLHQWLLLVHQ